MSDEMHTDFLCILYDTTLARRVSGAICTLHQEHKLQSTAVGTRDLWMREVVALNHLLAKTCPIHRSRVPLVSCALPAPIV
jgi:hypothetical protein